MEGFVTIVGGANFDISATLYAPFVAADSNPGHISLGYGGVARNVAHNLSLLGVRVKFCSIFGDDIFGGLMLDQCKNIGLDMSLSERVKGERSGMYMCINNQAGEMIASTADTEIINHITPAFLEKHTRELNESKAVVADTNLKEETLQYLLNNCVSPLFVDAVSSAKSWRIINALKNSKNPQLHSLKLNLKEALIVTESQNPQDAAQKLIDLGVQHIYITMGSEGAYCRNATDETTFPSLPVEVVNTTGAGDAFLSGVVYAFLQNIGFPQTAQYGLMAARATLLSNQAVNPNIANILL